MRIGIFSDTHANIEALEAVQRAHEQSMCYGTDETPWDEFAAARAALAARGLAPAGPE